ncbi:MAG: uroporphyrinogen-III synthase [Actinomycetota bacterium]|nr:uroporphyrinogen-III synthase [Actinomycetota bacterium]
MKVIVTRPREQAPALVERLEKLGHDVVVCPLIEVVPLGDGPVDTSAYDWVVVTSANGASELARRRAGTLQRVAAVGGGTAAALRERGITVDLVPAVSTQEGLLAEFPRPPGRVLFAGAEGARRLLVDALGADFVPLYRTVSVSPDDPPEGDLAIVASASTAHAFAALGRPLPVVSIGPQTTKAARAAGLEVVAEACPHDVDGLVAAVEHVAAAFR